MESDLDLDLEAGNNLVEGDLELEGEDALLLQHFPGTVLPTRGGVFG